MLATIGLAGCQPKEVTPSEVKCYGADPMFHTVYIGSDEIHHHFVWQNGKISGKWKVKQVDLTLSDTFPLESGNTRFVTRDETGRIDVIGLRK